MSQLSLSPHDRLAELKDETEKQKVKLTPEVKAYVQAHIEVVQEKLSKGEDVTEDDMKFVDEVMLMIAALKRHITFQQWRDLLHVAKVTDKTQEWIDEKFLFEGNESIRIEEDLDLNNSKGHSLPENLTVNGYLSLDDCTSFVKLPKNLTVETDLTLKNCTLITRIPEDLRVGRSLFLEGCTSLTRLPNNLIFKEGYLVLIDCSSLTNLPGQVEVGRDLYLTNCRSLLKLPRILKVKERLFLEGCTSLVSLPDNLDVGKDLYLSSDLSLKVKEDAERLKKEGKIKGEIIYK